MLLNHGDGSELAQNRGQALVVDAGSMRRALAKIEAAAGQTDGVVLGLATREEGALAAVRRRLRRMTDDVPPAGQSE